LARSSTPPHCDPRARAPYYDDGSMVTLDPSAPQAERLLALARAAL
jgi:hypothetical protein